MGKHLQWPQGFRESQDQPLTLSSPASPPQTRTIKLISRFGLLGVLLLFLSLAIFYSIIVPITQGEDELAHYRYLSFIAQKGRLPIDYAERKQAWYRADWPPLYHLIVGWAVSPLDTSRPQLKDVGESPRRRLVGEIFYPRLIIYTEDASWPWQDGVLAWHLGRFISIFFAAGALVFTHLTVLEICRGNAGFSPLPPYPPAPLLALATTTLLAFTPRYLFSSSMLSDDSLFIFLSAMLLWLLLWAVRGSDQWWLYAVMGLLLGLSIATKYSTGLLPLVVVPVVVWHIKRSGWSLAKAAGRVGLTWLFTIVGSSWWFGWIGYYFNTIQQDGFIFGLLKPLLASGPDVSMRRIFAFFGGSAFSGQERPAAIEAGSFWDWWVYLFQTFWGVPVLERDPLFPWAYLVVLLLCLIALVGLWRLWQFSRSELRVTLAMLALFVALLWPFPILRYYLTQNIFETGQGRHILYPAAQAIPILLILGWATFTRPVKGPTGEDGAWHIVGTKRDTFQPLSATFPAPFSSFKVFLPSSLLVAPSGLLLLWSVFQLFYMSAIYPAPLPVRTTTFNPASIPQPLKHNFGDAVQLLGYDFKPDPEQSIINLTLYWQARQQVDENFRTQVQLVDSAGRPQFVWLSHPLQGRYPTRAWDKGDVIRDTLALPLAAVPAASYDLQLTLLHEAEDKAINPEPFEFIYIPLTKQPAIANASIIANKFEYRLWLDSQPLRQRQTVALSWRYREEATADRSPTTNFQSPAPKPTWALLGPDDIPRLPVVTSTATAIFMVAADWPSGPYRLMVSTSQDSYQTEPLLTVANQARLFALPADLAPAPYGIEGGYVSVEANFVKPQGQPQIKLLGYVLPTRRLQPGNGLALTLYWQSLTPVLRDYLTFATLLDAQQRVYGQVDRYPSGFYSPILWAVNEVVPDSLVVPIAAEVSPGVYSLNVGQYQLVNGQPQALKLLQADQVVDSTAVVIGPLKVGGPPPEVTVAEPKPQVRLEQSFGDQITLLGYDQEQTPPVNCQVSNAACNMSIRLYWRADTIPSADYTTFLHLRNAANETVAQKDSPPAAGRYPTSLWDPGEIIVDEIILPLAQVPPGEYSVVAGLYEFSGGSRLTVPGEPANELRLNTIRVKE
jgi:4-amino-4-deoxy-L-arabinose transferase-like glycosyltransferase